jgi:hypothetical protein
MMREFAHQMRMYYVAGDLAAMLASEYPPGSVRSVAYHESGHAVTRLALNRPVARVEICSDGTGCTYPTYPPPVRVRRN